MPEIRLRVQENGASAGLTVEQARVIEAISPTIDAERVEGGVQITVEDYRGTPTTAVLYDGIKGDKGDTGDAGADGVSPTVIVEAIESGHRVTITDKQAVQAFDVMDGARGATGAPGATGATPNLSIGSVTTLESDEYADVVITGTPENPVLSFGIPRGFRGEPGAAGVSPVASVSESGGVATITVTDASGTTVATVADGTDGVNGTDGADGATFVPSVSSAGVISWTNDGGRTNPQSVDLVAAVISALPSAVGVSF